MVGFDTGRDYKASAVLGAVSSRAIGCVTAVTAAISGPLAGARGALGERASLGRLSRLRATVEGSANKKARRVPGLRGEVRLRLRAGGGQD